MEQEIRIGILITLPLVLEIIGLSFAVNVDSYIEKRNKKFMLIIVVTIFALVLQNILGYVLDISGKYPFYRILTGILGYSIRPLVIVLFYYIVTENKRFKAAWFLLLLNALIYLTALFSDICFTIDENNHFLRGPLGYSCHIVSAVFLIYLVYLTVTGKKTVPGRNIWIPVFNALLIVGSVVLDSFVDYRLYPVSFLTIAVTNCTVFYYIWLHLQFVKEHEQMLQAELRIQIMMSQIQPHFLYNTLSTIQALCRIDPKKAFDVTEKFGTYLRQNLDTLENTNLISVKQELEHTKIYAEIEMVRFPNIRVMYDIEDDAFYLPALTIQPMVENAIRHGVRIRDTGIVQVITKREQGFHKIVIKDNGKGFIPEKNGAMPGNSIQEGTHIGINNVRERVERMCGGEVRIDSQVGEGTTVTIRIPV